MPRSRAILAILVDYRVYPSPDVRCRVARERVPATASYAHWAGSHQEDDLGRRVDGEVVKEISLDGPLSLPDAL